MKIVQIYKEYVKKRKLYVFISILISLRLEFFSACISFILISFTFKLMLNDSLKLVGGVAYIVANSVVPIILSYKKFKKKSSIYKKV